MRLAVTQTSQRIFGLLWVIAAISSYPVNEACATTKPALTRITPGISAKLIPVILGDQSINEVVRLTFKLPSNVTLRKAKLSVTHQFKGKKLPTLVLNLKSAKGSVVISQLGLAAGRHSFQGRFTVGSKSSKWSKKLTVNVVDLDNELPPDGSPTPAPSPTPIVLGPPILPSSYSVCADESAQMEVLALVNSARVSAGVGPLVLHPQLGYAATAHSIAMARFGSLTHNGFITEIESYGFPGSTFGQNVGWKYTTPSQIVNGWLESEGHRANILKAAYLFMGISCIADGSGTTWWTQQFSG